MKAAPARAWVKMVAPVAFALHRFSTRLLRRCRPEWENRRWSNDELRRWAPLVKGDIVNVSGWQDSDKQSGSYQSYFPNASSYAITNIGGARGTSGHPNEIFLDLTAPLPGGLNGRYDVVFNHTTLEHIFDIRKATENLCAMSRDLVIVVVPFSQVVHYEPGSFLDFWRPTPIALSEMYDENGFKMVYCAMNDNPVYSIYTFSIATRHPERWRGIFPASLADRAETDRMALRR